MRVLVCGGRNVVDKEWVLELLDRLISRQADVVVHGGAKGADTFAGDWAEANNVEREVFTPNWDKYGRSAGFLRNKDMIDSGVDLVIAFVDERLRPSKGTRHTIKLAKQKEIRTIVCIY